LCEASVGGVGQCGSSPHFQCRAQLGSGVRGVAGLCCAAPVLDARLEDVSIQLAGVHGEQVAARDRAQHRSALGAVGGKHAAQPRDRHLQALQRRADSLLAPQHVDQAVAGQRAVGVDEQQCQQRHLPRTTDDHRVRAVAQLDRAEYRVSDHRRLSNAHAYSLTQTPPQRHRGRYRAVTSCGRRVTTGGERTHRPKGPRHQRKPHIKPTAKGAVMSVQESAVTGRARRLAAPTRLRRALVAIVVVLVGGAGVASQAVAQPGPLKVKGTFDSQTVTGPSCTAPTGQCFKGAFHGSIQGITEGSLLSVTPTQQTDVVLIDAAFTIHARRGDLTFGHEQIMYNTSPSGNGEFSLLAEVTGGTGRYAGATGYLQGIGTRPLSTGVATGTYVGKIALG
jgi:hypothetical protein